MLEDSIHYLGLHPGLLSAIGMTAVLAIVGLWYVLSHHLQAIMITILTAAGIGSGMLVLYRGFRADMADLMGIGLFLIVIFPIIFWQAIKMMEPTEPVSKTGRPPVRAMFSRKARG